MIAYVDPDRAFEYVAPQLERLEARAHLFIVTVRDDRAIAVDAFADGEHSAHDTDITALLPRLGCQGDFASWAETPRVLTPTDVDLLCYALGLEMPSDAPLPPRAPIERARALNLLNAIYDDPDSDDVRLVYADYLQECEDPHGQLIALQIARARRSADPSAGERALVQWYGNALAQPLTPHLRAGFELRRGFLGACAVDEQPPDEILASRAWATVESIETRHYPVLTNPQLASVRRAAIDTACLHRVMRDAQPYAQPFETLVGIATVPGERHAGLGIGDRAVWRALTAIGPLARLQTLALAPVFGELGELGELIAGPLGAQLEHLEVQLARGLDPRQLRTCFDAAVLPRLVLRLARGDGARIAVALERGAPHRLRLEIRDGGLQRPEHHLELFAVLRELGRGISRVELAVVNGQPRAAVRDGIREIFTDVVPALPAPWWSL